MGEAREQFEKALVDKIMTTSEIPLVIIQRPAEGEEAVEEEAIYQNGILTKVAEAGAAMGLLREPFIECAPGCGGNWNCCEFIWSATVPESSNGKPRHLIFSEHKILGAYTEGRHFSVGASDVPGCCSRGYENCEYDDYREMWAWSDRTTKELSHDEYHDYEEEMSELLALEDLMGTLPAEHSEHLEAIDCLLNP